MRLQVALNQMIDRSEAQSGDLCNLSEASSLGDKENGLQAAKETRLNSLSHGLG
jgi:hypothetical protein